MLETFYLCYWLMYVKTTDLYWFIKILNWKFCHIGALPRFCLLQIAVGQCFNWARLAPHPLAPEITRYIKLCQSGLNPSRIMSIIAIVSWVKGLLAGFVIWQPVGKFLPTADIFSTQFVTVFKDLYDWKHGKPPQRTLMTMAFHSYFPVMDNIPSQTQLDILF